MKKNMLWTEKYRPKKIADYIFHDQNQKKRFEKMISEGEIPHLLLSGVQGSGKTSLSGILVNELGIDPIDVLRINASDEKTESLREKVISFAQTYAMGKIKIVQLEEMDQLLPVAQALLRSILEDYSANCRFICTCNYENKIMPALKSRMQHFHFSAPEHDDVIIRAADILDAEGVTYDVDVLTKYISAGYPDIRKIIVLLQQNTIDGVLQATNTSTEVADFKLQLIDLLKESNIREARKLVCSQATRDELEDVYTFLYNNVNILSNDVAVQEEAIVIIANYLYKHALVADPEINMAAAFIELNQVINGK